MEKSGPNGGPSAMSVAPRPVSFSELVRVHYRWANELHGEKGVVNADAEDEFRRTLSAFQRDAGEIVDAYWCTSDASAVALTLKTEESAEQQQATDLKLARFLRTRGRSPQVVLRLHRVTDWVAADAEIADLLHHCDTLAIKVGEVLEGTAQRVAMQWILAVDQHLLGFFERSKNRTVSARERNGFVARQKKELLQIEDYYHRAGQKRARQIYVTGMLLGVSALPVIALGAAALIALFGALDLHSSPVRTFFACYAAGALGAVVSVLSRMSGRRGGFVVDYEIGRRGLRRLGSYRPLIGGILGLALYFLARTTMVQIDPAAKTFYFFSIISFLAGFSERWAQVVLGGAEQTIRDSLEGKTRSAT